MLLCGLDLKFTFRTGNTFSLVKCMLDTLSKLKYDIYHLESPQMKFLFKMAHDVDLNTGFWQVFDLLL